MLAGHEKNPQSGFYNLPREVTLNIAGALFAIPRTDYSKLFPMRENNGGPDVFVHYRSKW